MAVAVLLVFAGHTTAHAETGQSVFFQIRGRQMVQHPIYHRERHAGPACTNRFVRGSPCVGAYGLIVWG